MKHLAASTSMKMLSLVSLLLAAGCCASAPREQASLSPTGPSSKPVTNAQAPATSQKPTGAEVPPPKNEPVNLLKWKVTNFGGEGQVELKGDEMIIHAGSPLSGVTWQGAPPFKTNYEISLEAKRVEGGDFFLGLTVPVKEDAISLILGGWGGTLVGLSSIDGNDASENEYSQFMNFDQGKWYKVKMVVKEKQILVFIDDKQVIDANIEGRKVDTRIEVELNKPLGIATFSTTGAFRNFQMKKL